MKLFLSSLAISEGQADAFTHLVGKQKEEIKLALIENASDVYSEADKKWMYINRDTIKACGYQVELVDLREYVKDQIGLKNKLTGKDAVWLGGGNTYYLRWILKETGADIIIKELVESGVTYGGGSAGAIVAGPTLKHFENADDPKEAPGLVLDGLHLTETVVIPHIDNEKYGVIMEKADSELQNEGFKTILITDTEAVILDGDKTPQKVA